MLFYKLPASSQGEQSYVISMDDRHVEISGSALGGRFMVRNFKFDGRGCSPATVEEIEAVAGKLWESTHWIPEPFRMPRVCECGCEKPTASRNSRYATTTCRSRVFRANKPVPIAEEYEPPMFAMPGLTVHLVPGCHIVTGPSGRIDVLTGIEDTHHVALTQLAYLNERQVASSDRVTALNDFFLLHAGLRPRATPLKKMLLTDSGGNQHEFQSWTSRLNVKGYYTLYYASVASDKFVGPFLTYWEAMLIAIRTTQIKDPGFVADLYGRCMELFPGNPKGVAYEFIESWTGLKPPPRAKKVKPIDQDEIADGTPLLLKRIKRAIKQGCSEDKLALKNYVRQWGVTPSYAKIFEKAYALWIREKKILATKSLQK